MRIASTLVAAAVIATPLVVAGPAHAAPDPKVLAKGQLSPLSLDVAGNGTVWYSQNFGGMLMKVKPGKKPKVVHQEDGGAEVGAVSVHKGVVTFAVTPQNGKAVLKERTKKGKVRQVANLFRFEKRNNPDAESTYGFVGLDQACLDQLPPDFQPYPGIVESHPYASVTKGKARYVADAAGNTILKVRKNGKVKSVAVLPPQPLTVTEEMAGAFDMPECVVGHDFNFEPVPTDVEKGRDGMLYVTTLPGGPEDPSFGARGSVYRVNPKSGKAKHVAGGLALPTGLAVTGKGDIYVAELFGGKISKIRRGSSKVKTWREVALPGDVDWSDGRLYATLDVLPPEDAPPAGQVVRFGR